MVITLMKGAIFYQGQFISITKNKIYYTQSNLKIINPTRKIKFTKNITVSLITAIKQLPLRQNEE